MSERRWCRVLALLWRWAPALLLPAMALAGAVAADPAGAALIWVVLAAAAALAMAAAPVGAAGPAVGRAVVRRRACELPPPLAVTVPRVPFGPRAPGPR